MKKKKKKVELEMEKWQKSLNQPQFKNRIQLWGCEANIPNFRPNSGTQSTAHGNNA